MRYAFYLQTAVGVYPVDLIYLAVAVLFGLQQDFDLPGSVTYADLPFEVEYMKPFVALWIVKFRQFHSRLLKI